MAQIDRPGIYSRQHQTVPSQSAPDMSFNCRGGTRQDAESGYEADGEKNMSDGSVAASEAETARKPDGIVRTDVMTISYDEHRPQSSISTMSHPAR